MSPEVPDLAAPDLSVPDEVPAGSAWCARRTQLVDAWLVELHAASGAPEQGMALVATGGYGRGELCPQSDLDVLLLHGGRSGSGDADVAAVAERIWYPIWDAGQKLGHSVRTTKEALKLAADDLDTATSLLEVRHLAGDDQLVADLRERAAAQWAKRATRWLRTLAEATRERHHQAGEIAFLLEPDLKEGRGGLRDVHALRWAEQARHILLPGDDEHLQQAYDLILRVRVALHLVVERPNEVLRLQEQDAVAEVAAFADADQMMEQLAAAARTVAWTSDEAWDRIESALAGPLGRSARRDRELSAGGWCCATARWRSRSTPTWRVTLSCRSGWPSPPQSATCACSARRSIASRPSRRRCRHRGRARRARSSWRCCWRASRPSGWWRRSTSEGSSPGSSRSGRRCAASRSATPTTASPSIGTSARWLPTPPSSPIVWTGRTCSWWVPSSTTWARASPATTPRPASCWPSSSVPAWGSTRTTRPCWWTWSATTCSCLTWPSVATSTIRPPSGAWPRRWATCGGSTCSPRSPKPTRWPPVRPRGATGRPGCCATSWPAPTPTSGARRPDTGDGFPDADQRALMARGSARTVDGRTLTVVAPDRPGHLSRVAGVVALHGLDVLAASAHSEAGAALTVIQVAEAPERGWDRVLADLDRALLDDDQGEGDAELGERLAERARTYARPPTAAGVPTVALRFLDDASDRATVVEVQAPDGVGVLSDITAALAACHLDVQRAMVQTIGDVVVDTFYVCEADGARVSDLARRAEVEAAVRGALSVREPQ